MDRLWLCTILKTFHDINRGSGSRFQWRKYGLIDVAFIECSNIANANRYSKMEH